jgi:hypothetical protein
MKPTTKLPDRKICRARELFKVNCYKCLVKKPQSCRFATLFGGGVLCTHLEREDIAARTKKIKP